VSAFSVLWAALIIIGCLLGALCISWELLGPSLEIISLARVSPYGLLIYFHHSFSIYA